MSGTGINHYERLHVSPNADGKVIKAAYHVLMKKHHPDRGGCSDAAQAINEAYAVLSRSTARAKYDRKRRKLAGRRVGSFVITEVIAEGGFGVTYKGKHHLTEKPVCVKQPHKTHPELNAVLIHETNAIWDLRHHGLPTMRDLIEMEDGSLLLVMSFVEGMNLAELVEKIGRIPPVHVGWIIDRTLNVLSFLHRHEVAHGDMKPQNMMVQPIPHTITLVDFGLAMVNPTRHSECIGHTKHFASPEQLAGGPLIAESDLYSLGVVILYLLTGGDMCKVKTRQVPNDVPAPMRDYIARLLRLDVNQRPSWEEKPNPWDAWRQLREESFGAAHTKYAPLPGL